MGRVISFIMSSFLLDSQEFDGLCDYDLTACAPAGIDGHAAGTHCCGVLNPDDLNADPINNPVSAPEIANGQRFRTVRYLRHVSSQNVRPVEYRVGNSTCEAGLPDILAISVLEFTGSGKSCTMHNPRCICMVWLFQARSGNSRIAIQQVDEIIRLDGIIRA
jgi:hypothetical protein